MSKDLEDGLYKMTHEYEMEMLREAIKKEEEAVALRVTDLKAKGLYQYPVDISFEYDSEQNMTNCFVFKKNLENFPEEPILY